ncbi:TPA: 3-hydroxy-3-methylglutaryl-CoA lyase, partial [Enterococcus faecium]|nr:3-hydroxy-3-methylglutaryl-CoA lyase [Enterococcus faecium]HBH5522435.1 3-hydroxy-3-methylglutaryl-CoA lyase [Enterococcus faecium]HDL0734569.1 3-hydroxy-3-methylglutaryl-CoA lyase [Enterococcus faecium]
LRKFLSDKKILLIAPGKSSVDEVERIKEFVTKEEVVIISVNFEYSHIDIDYVFLSNLRRFHELPKESRTKCIVTSNIQASDVYLRTSYKKLLSEREVVRDNAGLMAIRFLADMNVDEIFLAGFDGYSHNEDENYGEQSMEIITKFALLDAMNVQMRDELSELAKKVKVTFLTDPRWVRIDK